MVHDGSDVRAAREGKSPFSFHLNSVFQRMALHFDEVQFTIYFYVDSALGVRFKNHCLTKVTKILSYAFS